MPAELRPLLQVVVLERLRKLPLEGRGRLRIDSQIHGHIAHFEVPVLRLQLVHVLAK